jgi:hypothetical protein
MSDPHGPANTDSFGGTLSRHRWSNRGDRRGREIEEIRRNKMLSRRRTSNFALDNTHPNCAPVNAARSKEIVHDPGTLLARGFRRFALKIALNARLLGGIVMLALIVPAYSQQEIDPAWYDPWAAPSKAVISMHRRDRQTTKNGGKSDRLRIRKSKQRPKRSNILFVFGAKSSTEFRLPN